MKQTHPNNVLFSGEKPFPTLPAVDHYAGAEKLMRKALAIQQQLGPVFDLTCDCEDGARTGAETEHAEMVAAIVLSAGNQYGRVGARIHDITHPHWRRDLEVLIEKAGERLAFITLPKVKSAADTQIQIAALREQEAKHDIRRPLPVHVVIETHGALREIWQIAALDGVESVDFGLMDFVSEHHGAIPGAAMKSPGQFEHQLVIRAKAEVCAAALACSVVPTHNVSTELENLDVIREDARRARQEYGFLRMWSIHPNQIEPILESMRPDFSEVRDAAEILIAAQDADWGPVRHRGRLHDRAAYRYFWELLLRARQTGTPIEEEASQRFFPK